MSTAKTFKSASFGMQCFWGSEAQFAVAPGVIRTKVGYTGGAAKNPTYKNMYCNFGFVDDNLHFEFQDENNIWYVLEATILKLFSLITTQTQSLTRICCQYFGALTSLLCQINDNTCNTYSTCILYCSFCLRSLKLQFP